MSRNRHEDNEEAVCEAVVALLEREFHEGRRDVSRPEKDGSGPPVEMRFRLGDTRFALEHTLIEPFPRAIATGLAFAELIGELEVRLNGQLPVPGTYNLTFPIDPATGRHRKSHATIREAIERWVIAAAAEMHAEWPIRRDRDFAPHGYFGHREATIEGIPLVLRRRVHWSESGSHDGCLFLARAVGPGLEDQRRTRLIAGLDKKLPKLADCKAEGDETILVLEYSDIALTSHIAIAEVLNSIWSTRNDWPDHIVIADTTVDSHWHAFRPVTDGKFTFDMEFIEIAKSESQLTVAK